jgi:hypothetical protein
MVELCAWTFRCPEIATEAEEVVVSAEAAVEVSAEAVVEVSAEVEDSVVEEDLETVEVVEVVSVDVEAVEAEEVGSTPKLRLPTKAQSFLSKERGKCCEQAANNGPRRVVI